MKKKLIIAVIGLDYVGLPLANAFARKYSVIGYDKNKNKIIQYKNGKDLTSELGNKLISTSKIFFTNNEEEIRNANVYIISVPTPIDENNNPFIEDTIEDTKLVGRMIKKGDLIIYESTFYPGMTREKCVPILEKMSNMVQRDNFYIGYSPERINPGDKIHKLENIKK